MANPNPSPTTRFGAGTIDDKRYSGGRTPSKWLHEFLDASKDKGPNAESRRIESAEAVMAVIRNPATPAKDVITAIELLWAYDMGKPTASIEVESPNGTLGPGTTIPVPLFALLENALKKREKAEEDAAAVAAETPPSEG
jgi:hypothetical protein